MRTPLLEQRPKKTNVISVGIAAAIESFYRYCAPLVKNHWSKPQWSNLRSSQWPRELGARRKL
eukprot:2752836-Rhodomonas_salina.1